MKKIEIKGVSNEILVYDCNVRDIFGNKFFIWHNTDLEEIRFIAKHKDYNKRRKDLDRKNLQHVIIQEWGNVIDIKKTTYEQLRRFFPSEKLPVIELLNIYD